MLSYSMNWQILHLGKDIKNTNDITDILLKNRGITSEKEKKEFFSPINPLLIPLKTLKVSETEVEKAIKRIKLAKKNDEHVIVYGDYDADGITGTGILWETLHELGVFVLPHIPERFSEGYGINAKSVENLKSKDSKLNLIITVDNGITAVKGVQKANELGIDVIIVDHHQPPFAKASRGKEGFRYPNAFAVIHTLQTSGSALAWFFSRELIENWKIGNLLKIDNWKLKIASRLELAAIGTIADQLPLIGINRSIVKYGLEELNKTKRPGLLALFKESGIENEIGQVKKVGTYEVGYIIAPRINAMGRLKHGLESLRLICTKDKMKAFEISKNVGGTNTERQQIVEKAVLLARKSVTDQQIIVIAGEDYHEGVIGLAAGRLVEEFYRPAIVLSVKGNVAKASARSISGFNIIEAIRAVSLHAEGGGHPMAAGFSIETEKIDKFTKEINKYAKKFLTTEMLSRKTKIDCALDFGQINDDLLGSISQFEPTGMGNPAPTFMAEKVVMIDGKTVGREKRHLKLKLKQDEHVFDSIFFGGGEKYPKLTPGSTIDIAFQPEENVWNDNRSIQLKVKDLKY